MLYLGFVRHVAVELDVQLAKAWPTLLLLLLLQLVLRRGLDDDLRNDT